MKNEGVVSRIISAIKGNKVAVRENLFYDTVKGTPDFALDDLINLRTAEALLNGAIQVIRTPITDNPMVINWQTDIAPGFTDTYATVRGNYVEGAAFVGALHVGDVTDVTFDGSGNVDVVTLDLGSIQVGYIKFG